MITQKGPLSPDQLGMAQAQAYNLQAQNLEVRAALANPDVVRAFSNPEVRSVLDYGVSNSTFKHIFTSLDRLKNLH